MKLRLERPLAVFDIESTGLNRKTDRIIDLAIVLLQPAGPATTHAYRFHPGIPIPPEATAIHGIRDEDVQGKPPFADGAGEILALLKDCDLAGFNILHFDIPVLCEEFARAGTTFDMEGRRVLDAQRIFHKKEPRDLSAALQFYCGEFHLGAHGALDDVRATLRVIEGQLERYPDLPTDMDALEAFCNPRDPSWVDRTGKLKWQGQDVVVNFGKYQGRALKELARAEPNFLNWILKGDFPRDTQQIVRNAIAGHFPPPGAAAPG